MTTKYKMTLIFGMRKRNYEGEYAPELLDAWDEYTMTENYEGFNEKFNKFKRDPEFSEVRLMEIAIPEAAVYGLFEVPTLEASVKPVKDPATSEKVSG